MNCQKILLTVCLSTITYLGYSQTSNNATSSINAHPNIDNLLKERHKNNQHSNYKIQLYYGNLTKAHTILDKFNNKHNEWKGKIEYETPNYKVWVGSFQTRIEADRALIKISKNFPHAFIFKPENK